VAIVRYLMKDANIPMTTKTDTTRLSPKNRNDSRTLDATAILVLGMHRSGTSALTRVLNLLGVELGGSLMRPAAGNETGFWEHQDVVKIHATLLKALGMTWDDPRRLPDGWLESDAAHDAVEALLARLSEDFTNVSLWGVKDPRMCRFLPLWQKIFATLGAKPGYVILLRHPLEIVRSLHQRNHMTTSRGLLLWLRHTLEAEAGTRESARVLVRYSDLMSDWQPVATRISDALGISLDLKSPKAAAAIKSFIRPSMRHYSLDAGALAEDQRLMHWAGEAHQALETAADGDTSGLADTLDQISRELDLAGYYFDETLAEAAPREARLAEEIHDLHTRLHEREKWVAERDRNLLDRENTIHDLHTRTIHDLHTRLHEREKTIHDLHTRLHEREKTIQGLLAQSEALESQQHQIRNLHAQLSDNDSQIVESHAEITRLLQNFHHMGSTWSWRLTRPFRGAARVWSGLLGSLNMRTHTMQPVSFHQMRHTGLGRYQAETSTPHMVIASRRGRPPRGWVRVDYKISAKRLVAPFLFFDDGEGFREATRLRLPPIGAGAGSAIVHLPDVVTGLRLDPVNFIGEFELGSIRVTELNRLMLAAALVKTRVQAARLDDRGLLGLLGTLRSAFLRGGLAELKRGLRHQATEPLSNYGYWSETYTELSTDDFEAIRRHIKALKHIPLLSVIIPTYNTPPEILRIAIESIREQIYERWELCIADDASTSEETKALLREYEGTDARIKIVFRPNNGHISEASNSAIEMAHGEFIVLVDHDDELTPHALYMLAAELNRHPDADIIYSDEDKIDQDGQVYQPYFKPDFSSDMFLSQNYINHLGAYRRSLVEEVGRFRKGFEGSQDYDLALRVIEKSSPERIRHIPFVLYHWRSIEGSVASGDQEKPYALDAARKAITEHLERQGRKATVVAGRDEYSHRVLYALPQVPPKVSLIVPTRDHVNLLKMVVDGVRETNDYPHWDMTIVDNGSVEAATADYLSEITQDKRIKVLRDDGPFNFSRLNNRAARATDGQIIGLINNDIEPISKDWLSEMVRQVTQPGVGAVGAKLYYPNDTLQHGGIIVGLGGVAGHFDKRLPRDQRGYFGRAMLVQNFSAVTAACMLVPRAVFEEVQGLDEINLAVAFNDVDFCLKIRKAGYRLIWTPYAELYHHESVSRGLDTDSEKIDRFAAEIRVMQDRWRTQFEADPFYNPNLTLDRERPIIADPPRVIRPWVDYYDA
jgi:GT2 family glycosyltransferase